MGVYGIIVCITFLNKNFHLTHPHPSVEGDYYLNKMKLRINPSSIRIRLSKSETETLSRNEKISDILIFPDGEGFTYSLRIASSFKAEMNKNDWVFSIPKEQADGWLASEKLALEVKLPREGMSDLILLVEKDLHDL